MAEPRGRVVVDGFALLLQTWQLALDVVQEHVRQVVGEAAPHHDPKGREILTAECPKRVKDVEETVLDR